jgi:molybdopterin molybdotransferase
MISVEEALERLLAPLAALAAEQIAVSDCFGRVLAEDIVARRTQPPFAASAMDGYAVRAADVAAVPARLRIVGAAPAGGSYDRTVARGEAVRIFTGAPAPIASSSRRTPTATARS